MQPSDFLAPSAVTSVPLALPSPTAYLTDRRLHGVIASPPIPIDQQGPVALIVLAARRCWDRSSEADVGRRASDSGSQYARRSARSAPCSWPKKRSPRISVDRALPRRASSSVSVVAAWMPYRARQRARPADSCRLRGAQNTRRQHGAGGSMLVCTSVGPARCRAPRRISRGSSRDPMASDDVPRRLAV